MTARQMVLLASLGLTIGCSNWVRLPQGPPAHAPDSRLFQVWTGDTVHMVRAVHLDGDTLRGVVTRRNYCKNCTIALNMADVDSVRTANSSASGVGYFLAGVGLGAVIFWYFMLHNLGT